MRETHSINFRPPQMSLHSYMHTAHTPVSMCIFTHAYHMYIYTQNVKDVRSFFLSASDIRRIPTIPMEGRCEPPSPVCTAELAEPFPTFPPDDRPRASRGVGPALCTAWN